MDIQRFVAFDGPNSKVVYAELGDDVTRRISQDDDEDDDRERSFYLVEPTLVALQSHTQILLINTLQFAYDSGSVYHTLKRCFWAPSAFRAH